jgi:F420-0:gamma-glutamyl ligase-like protein
MTLMKSTLSKSIVLALSGLAGIFFIAGDSAAQTPAPAPAAAAGVVVWEYKVETLNLSANRTIETQLNRLGAEGWELIGMSDAGRAIFKRPKK